MNYFLVSSLTLFSLLISPMSYAQSSSPNLPGGDIRSGTHVLKFADKEYHIQYSIIGAIVKGFHVDFQYLAIDIITMPGESGTLELSLPKDFINGTLKGLPPLDRGQVGKSMGQFVMDVKGLYVEGKKPSGPPFLEVADADILSLGCNTDTVLKLILPPGTNRVHINNNDPLYGESPTLDVQTQQCMYELGEPVLIMGRYYNPFPESTQITLRITSSDGHNILENSTGQITPNHHFSSVFVPERPGIYYINATSTKLPLSSSIFFIVRGAALLPFGVGGKTYIIKMDSTSSSYAFTLSVINKELQVQLSGVTDTIGHSEITLPKDLIDGNLSVKFDGFKSANSRTSENITHLIVAADYIHGNATNLLHIVGTTAIPEFPLVFVILGSAIASVIFLSRVYRAKKFKSNLDGGS